MAFKMFNNLRIFSLILLIFFISACSTGGNSFVRGEEFKKMRTGDISRIVKELNTRFGSTALLTFRIDAPKESRGYTNQFVRDIGGTLIESGGVPNFEIQIIPNYSYDSSKYPLLGTEIKILKLNDLAGGDLLVFHRTMTDARCDNSAQRNDSFSCSVILQYYAPQVLYFWYRNKLNGL